MADCHKPRHAFTILVENPDAAKTLLALGLLVIIQIVPNTLVVNDLQGKYWEKRMAEYQSIINIMMFTLAFFATGPLGRLGDRFGNRLAVALVCLCTAMPSVVLLAFGPSEVGLTAWGVARVLSGLSGASFSGSPAVYALINEVSHPDDVETLLGLAYASCAVFWMLGSFLGLAILHVGKPTGVLWFGTALSFVVLAVIASIGGRKDVASDLERQMPARDSPESTEGGGASDTGKAIGSSRSPCTDLIASFLFAYGNATLCSLCVIAALVSIPETVLFDVNFQFVFSNLGILGEDKAIGGQRRIAAFTCAIATQISLVLGCYTAGVLSKKYSSRRVLAALVPITAVLQSLAALVAVFPHMWAVALASLFLGFSLMVLPPLQALVAQLAPPDRVSEAMGTVGAFKCMASLCGNIFVICGVPLLQRTGMQQPLWPVYPVCGLLTLSALLFVRRLPVRATSEAKANATATEAMCAIWPVNDNEHKAESETGIISTDAEGVSTAAASEYDL